MKTNGYSAKLVPGLGPDDASYKSAAWSSSDESVAAVDQNGIVTPGQPGTANIIYTADNGSPDDPSDDKTATCKVTVTKPAAVSYLDYDADSDSFISKSNDDYTTLIDSLSTITNYTAFSNNLAVLGKANETHWYYVDHDVTFGRMNVNGDVHLILKNGVTMKANLGISVGSGNSLTIYVQSEDTATAGKLVTGSGLNANKCSLGTGGNITINGGTISAAGGFSGVGIQGTITFNGGNITVRPATYWAVGISGTITVNGGYISAQGYHDGVNVEAAITGTLITADKMVVLAGNEDNPTNPVRTPGWVWSVLIYEAVPVDGITADPLELNLNGPSETIQVHFSPENASYYTTAWLTFESDNPDVASVDQNGVVTPGVVGTATITITASNGTETTDDDKTTTCTVNVTILDVSEITLDKTSVEMMVTDAAVKLKPTIAPQYATYRTADMITWSSDNPAVATVDQSGNVTPLWEGTATITATAVNGTPDDPSDDKTATCTVTVSMVHVTGVSLDITELNLDEHHKPVKLTGTIEPSDASFKTFKWVSDDPEIATVDQNGTVTPVSVGTTKIRFIADNGSPDDTSDDKTAVCDVTLFTPDAISYLEYDAQSGTFSEATTSAYTFVNSDDTSWGTSKTQWYYVNENITINNSVKVNGNVNLILGDNAALTVNRGILVNYNDNASLTIYAQSQNEDTMGKLITTGGSSCSGIGGAFGSYRGNVTINGGMITATDG